MRFHQVTLAEADALAGVVVVVDVLRAFTTAALALAAGATAVRCVGSVSDALAARAAHPDSLAIGEVDGRRPPGFDLGNSPTALADTAVDGRLLIQRTTAGTQGLVAAAPNATALYACSFVCAGPTARVLTTLAPDSVSFVLTGVDHRDGDEDRACADYVAALIADADTDPRSYLERVRSADAAAAFRDPLDPDMPASDVDHALRLDAVDFALRAELDGGWPTLTAQRS